MRSCARVGCSTRPISTVACRVSASTPSTLLPSTGWRDKAGGRVA
jgi:hypothetical protein